MADSSIGVYVLPPSLYSFAVPIKHLKEPTVSDGWVSSRSFAAAPSRNPSPPTYPTTLGKSASPSSQGINSGLPSLQQTARLFVVPKSMPMIAISIPPSSFSGLALPFFHGILFFHWNALLPLECTFSIGMHFFHLIILLLRPVFYCYAKRKLSKRINRNKQIAYSLRTAIAV